MNIIPHNNPGMTEAEREKLELEERERVYAKALETQTVRFAVAPKQALTSSNPNRGVVSEGEEFTYADLEQYTILEDGTKLMLQDPAVLMGSLVARGLVLEKAGL